MSAPDERRFQADFLIELFRDPLDPAYEAAARRRAARGPEPGWLRAAGRGVRLLTVAVIGFLLMVAYQQVVAAEPESNRTRAGLVAEVHERQAETDELQRQAEQLRDEVDRLREAALDSAEAAQLRNLAAAAGLGRVQGGGAVVRLRDAPRPVDPVTGQPSDDNPGRVLDRDLQAIVNALWSVGAEAIAINGQRVSSTATIRAAGDAILVDFKPVASPYEVAAIGPADLDRTFGATPTAEKFRQLARVYGMTFEVRPQRELTLPAATDPQLRHARPPAPAGGPSVPPSSPGGPSVPPASPLPSATGGPP